MPSPYVLFHVDAFTSVPFRGNPAGVITNADGLTSRQMQRIAAELRHSETAFVFEPDGDDHDLRVRFFTPALEVPSCGHATLAAHFARASELGLDSCRVRMACGAGLLTIDVIRHEPSWRIWMHQLKPTFSDEPGPNIDRRIEAALGITQSERDPRAPIQIVSTGHSKVMVGLSDPAVLHRLHPDMDALRGISAEIGSNGFHVFVIRSGSSDSLTECRMFAPALGIPEDPVTGNGNGPLGAYLVRHGLARHDGTVLQFSSSQGLAMGRPGVVHVRVEIEDGEPVAVSVGDEAVIVYRTTLLPDLNDLE